MKNDVVLGPARLFVDGELISEGSLMIVETLYGSEQMRVLKVTAAELDTSLRAAGVPQARSNLPYYHGRRRF